MHGPSLKNDLILFNLSIQNEQELREYVKSGNSLNKNMK